MNGLINRARCRRRLLAFAAEVRAHKFQRVSAATLDKLEANVEAKLRQVVFTSPSKGKTL